MSWLKPVKRRPHQPRCPRAGCGAMVIVYRAKNNKWARWCSAGCNIDPAWVQPAPPSFED